MVKDVLALLEKIPIWKELKALPARVKVLEDKITALEDTEIEEGEHDACPSCKQKTFKLISSSPDSMMGDLGIVQRKYRCSSCGFEESRTVDPAK